TGSKNDGKKCEARAHAHALRAPSRRLPPQAADESQQPARASGEAARPCPSPCPVFSEDQILSSEEQRSRRPEGQRSNQIPGAGSGTGSRETRWHGRMRERLRRSLHPHGSATQAAAPERVPPCPEPALFAVVVPVPSSKCQSASVPESCGK